MQRREAIKNVGAALVFGSVAQAAMGAQVSRAGAGADASALAPVFGAAGRGSLRLEIDALEFGPGSAAFDVDAVFEAAGQRFTHRIGSYRPTAASPQSQLFGFHLNPKTFVGFDVLPAGSTGACRARLAAGCGRALGAAYRGAGTGHFLLEFDPASADAVVREVAKPSSVELVAHEEPAMRRPGLRLYFRVTSDRA